MKNLFRSDRAPAPVSRLRALFANRSCLATSIILTLSCSASQVNAQSTAAVQPSSAQLPVETLVITATRHPSSAIDSLLSTIIIEGDTLRQSPLALTEQLARYAQLDLRSNGGPGQTSTLQMRGASGGQILVLVDGVHIGSATTGNTALENFPVALIERIEVVRGGLSGLYGSDAMGGVIQIFTRGNGSGTAGLRLGSNSRRQIDASGLWPLTADRSLTLGATLGSESVDAPSATNASAPSFLANPDKDPYRNLAGNLRLRYSPNSATQINALINQSKAVTHFDGGPNRDDINRRTLSNQSVQAHFDVSDALRTTIQIGQGKDDSKVESAFPGRFRTTQQQLSLGLESAAKQRVLHWQLGVDSLRERVVSTTSYDRSNRNTNAAYLAANLNASAHLAEANLRHDQESQFGKRTTGSLGYGYSLTPQWRLGARVATSFRAPSFNDLYFPNFSNPNLKPERGRSSELSARFRQQSVDLSLNVFESRINNLISFSSVTFLPENVTRTKTTGVELQANWRSSVGNWRAMVTQQNPRDEITGKRLRNRSKSLASLDWQHAIGAFDWRMTVDHRGVRFDSTNESATSRLPSYTLLDVQLGYRIGSRWALLASVSNASNRNYESTKGYNTPRREWLLGVKANY